jgi:hypothetical protein
MLTREIGTGGYSAGCQGAPPPLHVHPDNAGAAWYPAVRPDLPASAPHLYWIEIPVVAPFGDDPTDPSTWARPHAQTYGMMPRFNVGPYAERWTVEP